VEDTGFIAEYIYPDRVAEEQVFFQMGSWEQEVECDRQFFLDHYEFLDTVFIPSVRL
jgi:hypothetical protein